MRRRRWIVLIPVLAMVAGGVVVVATRAGTVRPFASPRVLELERQLGRHLYTPTWLPAGGRTGVNGIVQGRHRILQDFSDGNERSLCILAQEPRTPERDRYHRRVFERAADATADINGSRAHFIVGSSGERRLFWNRNDAALIISSNILTDEQMIQIARKVK